MIFSEWFDPQLAEVYAKKAAELISICCEHEVTLPTLLAKMSNDVLT